MSTPTAETAWTYLQLCQRAAIECGVANASLAATPSGVVSATGELKRLCGYVADAWRELQGRRHWSWMWELATIVVPEGQSTLATGIVEDRWDKNLSYVPGASSDSGRFMDYMPWQQFRLLYPRVLPGNSIGVWSIDPVGTFCIDGIAPVGGFTATVERWKNPTALRADDDVPGLPADLQMILVYKAMRKYAQFDEAGNQRAIAMDETRDLMRDLQIRCLPQITLGSSLLDTAWNW